MSHDANMIVPRLWLGNRNSALNDNFLRKHNITVVFNCTKDLPFSNVPLKKYRVPVDDNLHHEEIQNMERWAPEIVYKVMNEYNQGRTILVHCFAGVQRSAAVVAMTLVVMSNKPVDEIMAYMRSKRPVAFFPMANFEKSIRGFESSWKRVVAPQNCRYTIQENTDDTDDE
jgi:protein-tyrosine phosphatase